MKETHAERKQRTALGANLTKGCSGIPGFGIPSDWSILTGFADIQMLWQQSETSQ